MPNEKTPLSNATTFANNLLTKENAESAAKAAKYTKEQAQILAHMISDGHSSIRVMALLGGMAMMVTSAFGVWNRFVSLHWISAIVECYTFLLGMAVIALEARAGEFKIFPERWTSSWEAQLRKYALFLSFVSGRGGLYFVAGTLQLSQLSLVDLAVGGYMSLVGVTYIIVGKQTSRKLSDLRKSIHSEDFLRQKFNSADLEHSGSLSMEQFQSMLSKQFGVYFNSRELDVSFQHLDSVHDRDGRVTLEEFLEWWNTCHFDEASMEEFGLSV